MTTPATQLISGPELGTYLGDPGLNIARANLMIQLAQDACLTVVDAIPPAKLFVLYRVAGNAYLSATSRSYQQSQADAALGNFTRTNGVTLTVEDRADLLGDEESASTTGAEAFTIRLKQQQSNPWDAWQPAGPWGCW